MPKLETAALPKGTAGRRAKETDSAFLTALIKGLTETPTVETAEGTRPNTFGSSDLFETKGKASSDARRYINAIGTQVPHKLRSSVYPVKENGKPDQFKWRVYIPLSAGDSE